MIMMVVTIRTLAAMGTGAVMLITQDKMKVSIKCTKMVSMGI
tara:strand:+ start:301 stop:426 length:126 start_codon:yes stop_codon:yes gene_type:complete